MNAALKVEDTLYGNIQLLTSPPLCGYPLISVVLYIRVHMYKLWYLPRMSRAFSADLIIYRIACQVYSYLTLSSPSQYGAVRSRRLRHGSTATKGGTSNIDWLAERSYYCYVVMCRSLTLPSYHNLSYLDDDHPGHYTNVKQSHVSVHGDSTREIGIQLFMESTRFIFSLPLKRRDTPIILLGTRFSLRPIFRVC